MARASRFLAHADRVQRAERAPRQFGTARQRRIVGELHVALQAGPAGGRVGGLRRRHRQDREQGERAGAGRHGAARGASGYSMVSSTRSGGRWPSMKVLMLMMTFSPMS